MSVERVLVDGREEGVASTLDRGLHYGDGVFETIACRGRRPCFVSRHLARLSDGCARLAIPFADTLLLREEIRALAEGDERCIVKAIVTRGDGTARGYASRGDERPRRILLRYGWPESPPSAAIDGVRVRIARLKLAENPLLARIKHLNRLEHVLASAEARDPTIAESLLFSRSGLLVSGTMSNVFVVTESGIRTPLIDRCGVEGVMRGIVLEIARDAGLGVAECYLSSNDLANAREVFLTNARIGIWPVREIDDRVQGIGPVTRALQGLLEPRLTEGGGDA